MGTASTLATKSLTYSLSSVAQISITRNAMPLQTKKAPSAHGCLTVKFLLCCFIATSFHRIILPAHAYGQVKIVPTTELIPRAVLISLLPCLACLQVIQAGFVRATIAATTNLPSFSATVNLRIEQIGTMPICFFGYGISLIWKSKPEISDVVGD